MWSRIKYISSGIIFKKPLNSFKMDSKAMLINKIVVDTVCECPFMFYSNGQLILFRFPLCLYNDMYADVSLMAPSYVAGHTSALCNVWWKTGSAVLCRLRLIARMRQRHRYEWRCESQSQRRCAAPLAWSSPVRVTWLAESGSGGAVAIRYWRKRRS